VGARAVNAAVADAGPLIHLAEVDGLALLRIFAALHIPDAVWLEAVRPNRVQEVELAGLRNIHQHTITQVQVTQFLQEIEGEGLQTGDVESLCLCQHLQVSTMLTDDLSVREAAKQLSLTPVGSLGIVVRAYRVGHISLADAERYLNALYDISSLFVTLTLSPWERGKTLRLMHREADVACA
jgi:predicted nucleic acid-binding protein